MPGKGQVEVHKLCDLAPSQDMQQWPDGQEIVQVLTKVGAKPHTDNADFWQAAIRWSLLRKYGHCPEQLMNPYAPQKEGSFHKTVQLSSDDMSTINAIWQEQCELAAKNTSSELDDADLKEFLSTTMSNGRPLMWSFMDCGPACQFKLHAHPNLEVIHAVQGNLHEIRMNGKPVTKTFPPKDNGHVKGPDLSSSDRSWKFATLHEGDFLINEVGSIHKSFAATNGEGCQLLVLWGGSHADVTANQEPTSVSVQGAVDKMDQQLCDCRSDSQIISETFLPQSERSN